MNTEEILRQVNSLRRELDKLESILANITDSTISPPIYKTDKFEYPSFKSIESPQEQDFIDIVKDGVIKIDEVEYPNSIFLFKNGKYLFEYNLKYEHFYLNYGLIWSVFETKYSMEYQQIQEFMKDMMEKHFNCKNIIPLKSMIIKIN